jgi:uncharacterized protein (DUF433 family)
MNDLADRITINPKQCGGRPCIRGMRIRVSDILDLFASGLSKKEILEEMTDLEVEEMGLERKYLFVSALIVGTAGVFWLVSYFSGNPDWKRPSELALSLGLCLAFAVPVIAVFATYILEIIDRLKRGSGKKWIVKNLGISVFLDS